MKNRLHFGTPVTCCTSSFLQSAPNGGIEKRRILFFVAAVGWADHPVGILQSTKRHRRKNTLSARALEVLTLKSKN